MRHSTEALKRSARFLLTLAAFTSAGCLANSLAAAPPAPCEPAWAADSYCVPGLDGVVNAMITWDDGTGPAPYVGGEFLAAGCEKIAYIARWDGESWTPLGESVNHRVASLHVHDDGSGEALYVGGSFTLAGAQPANRIAKWDGRAWSALGAGVTAGVSVNALASFDDGSSNGRVLYVGGQFTMVAGQAIPYLARWDGQSWSNPGAQLADQVHALHTHDDGNGPALYIGGGFNSVAGMPIARIVRWDGATWQALGSGANDTVRALASVRQGGVSVLAVGGSFGSAGGAPGTSRIARWNGAAWSSFGSGMWGSTPYFVSSLLPVGDGPTQSLVAGGNFLEAGGIPSPGVARWTGAAWQAMSTGATGGSVSALAELTSGSGSIIHAGGSFTAAGGLAVSNAARWQSETQTWQTITPGFRERISCLLTVRECDGDQLYAGGSFLGAGGQVARRVARWNGKAWSPLGGGLQGGAGVAVEARALAWHDDGSGAALYVGGNFTIAGGVNASYIARWNGTNWSPVGSGMNGVVAGLAVFDDGSGPVLVATGSFTTAGGQPANRIAKWDGAQWSPLGSGLNGSGACLLPHHDGTKPILYVGGGFSQAGGLASSRAAIWDGQAWTAMPGVLGDAILAMVIFDDGGGPALHAGGTFSTSGVQPMNFVAKRLAGGWAQVGGGTNQFVRALAVHDDGGGGGLALYAAGDFTQAGSGAAKRLARWNGTVWAEVGGGLSGPNVGPTQEPRGQTLLSIANGPMAGLYVGGDFNIAGSVVSSALARWACDPQSAGADLNGDHEVNGLDLGLLLVQWGPCPACPTTPCPADFNGDGVVDDIDLALLIAEWGPVVGVGRSI